MPRAKKTPSEGKTKQPALAAEERSHSGVNSPAPTGFTASAKTTEQPGKPVSSVNSQGSNAGVKANGRGDTDLEAAIRARAYEIWERRGRPQGAGHDDWLQAEREILSEREKRTA